MAILRQRLNKRLSDGTLTPVHLETSSDVVIRPDGTTVEATLAGIRPFDPSTITLESLGAAASAHTHTLESLGIVMSTTDITPGSALNDSTKLYLVYE